METALIKLMTELLEINSDSLLFAVGSFFILLLGFFTLGTALLLKLATNTTSLIKLASRSKNDNDFEGAIRNVVDVTDSLRSLKHDHFADRASVVQMHNGDHSVTGIDFYKYTISHQSTTKDIHPTIDKHQRKPIGSVLHIFEKLKLDREPYIAISDAETMSDDVGCRAFYHSYVETYGAKSVYFFPLEDLSGYIFGFGMVEYCRKPYDMEVERLHEVADRFKQIGALLTGVEVK